jgi:hypothetical protein
MKKENKRHGLEERREKMSSGSLKGRERGPLFVYKAV